MALLSYTLIVSNAGPDVATNVVVTDELPGAVSYADSGADTGAIFEAGGVVTWTVGTLASGVVETAWVAAWVDGAGPGATVWNTRCAGRGGGLTEAVAGHRAPLRIRIELRGARLHALRFCEA